MCYSPAVPTPSQDNLFRRKRVTRRIFVVVGILGLTGIVALAGRNVFAQSTDPHFGTWKRNNAKSKLDPAAPVPTRKYEPFEGDGVRMTTEIVGADGKPSRGGYAAHFDGKPYRDLGNNPWDSVVIKKANPYTYDVSLLAKGKVYSTNTAVISKDGKTLTVTSTRTDESGKTTTTVTVWDKQ